MRSSPLLRPSVATFALVVLAAGCQTTGKKNRSLEGVGPETQTTRLRPREGVFHVVQPGETLASIAGAYQKSADTLRALNGLDPNEVLQPGMPLFIPGASRPQNISRPPEVTPGSQPSELRPYLGPHTSGMIWPVKGEVLVRYRQPVIGVPNEGITVAAPGGCAVWAAQDGRVMFCHSHFLALGKMVLVEHASGTKTLYGHLSEILVKPGDRIRQGDVIARVGQSGRASRPQLHLRVYKNGATVDPLPLLH
ncbi:MAG: M23 family metallopeptidase [Planctomycetes bacterium]|nr:M23 family metallopeptidase [Planctomycetota bacterium]